MGVVQGLAGHHHLSWRAGGAAILGMLIAIGMWWVYFDFVSHRQPRVNQIATMSWIYLHLPLTISIAAVGAAVLNMVEHAGEALPGDVRWLLTGAITVAFVTIALLIQTIQSNEAMRSVLRTGSIVVLVAGVLIGVLGASTLETLPLLLSTIVLMLAPAVVGLWVWIKRVVIVENALPEPEH
ncbi:low temperature requirement protein A [Chloroflexi bacterium TSY]|nr:low temperature requirement protein A [Chloroflexi bacterium TSY]